MLSASFKRYVWVSFFVLVSILFGPTFAGKTSAVTPKSIDCSESIYSMLFVESKKPLQGTIYAKLAKKIPDSPLNLYYQDPTTNGRCNVIGQINANSDTWQLVGKIDESLNISTLYADGPQKSADVYQATIKTLILPDSNLCEQVDTECHVTYQGKKGILKPILQSGAIDMISIYTVLPISDSKIKEVAYFSDGQFLYFNEKKQIEPVNKNYIADGQHTVTTQVTFDNNQKFIISETIDRGKDYTGLTTLKSYYYKSQKRYLYVIGGVVIFIVISVALMIARAIHNRKLYKQEHGIENYKPLEPKKEDKKDDIVVG